MTVIWWPCEHIDASNCSIGTFVVFLYQGEYSWRMSKIDMMLIASQPAGELISYLKTGLARSTLFLPSQMNSHFRRENASFVRWIMGLLNNIFVSLSQKAMETFCSRIIVRFLGKDYRYIKPFTWGCSFGKSRGRNSSFIYCHIQQMHVT